MDVSNQFTWVVNRPMMEEYGIDAESLTTERGLIDAMKKIKEQNVKNKDGASVYPYLIHGAAARNWRMASEVWGIHL